MDRHKRDYSARILTPRFKGELGEQECQQHTRYIDRKKVHTHANHYHILIELLSTFYSYKKVKLDYKSFLFSRDENPIKNQS